MMRTHHSPPLVCYLPDLALRALIHARSVFLSASFWQGGSQIVLHALDQFQSRCLEAVDDDLRQAFHQLVTQRLVFFAVLPQVRGVENNRVNGLVRQSVEVPEKRREKPRPSHDLPGADRRDLNWMAGAVRLERDGY